NLSLKTSTANQPTVELSEPDTPTQPKSFSHNDQPFPLSQLIQQNSLKTLGAKPLKLHGHPVEVLVKLNQAQGNSFQVHAKTQTPDWLPKPESWYFFEPGLVTLGIKPDTDWSQYQRVCQLVFKESQLISRFIKQGEITVEEGR